MACGREKSGRPSRFGLNRWLALLVALTAIPMSGCGIFGGDDDEELTPAELLDFEETLDVRRIWSDKVGKGSEFLRIGLAPAGDGNRIYAASYDGNVNAYDPASGKRIWRVETDTVLSAGPGVGDDVVVVAGYDGDLIALQTTDGSEIWRINISGEALARPIVRNGEVVVYTIDGRLRVFSLLDGSQSWALEQSLPALTQRGSATPIVVGASIVSGFDNGRLIASSLSDGVTMWEAILTPPAGRSDLDRLADIDGSMAAVGQDIYASGYNGRIASIAAESGELLWDREISTHVGLTADWNNIYAVGDQGELIALLRQNGTDVWRQDGLLNREPTAPVVFGSAVVVGDFDGYTHFFSNSDGRPVARERVGKGMISGVPFVMGDKLYVQSESGTLAAFAVRTPEPEPEATQDADAAEEET
ncbi:MAG: outer membrane protein assembly factor BamB [Woeseiaceae bacterium]